MRLASRGNRRMCTRDQRTAFDVRLNLGQWADLVRAQMGCGDAQGLASGQIGRVPGVKVSCSLATPKKRPGLGVVLASAVHHAQQQLWLAASLAGERWRAAAHKNESGGFHGLRPFCGLIWCLFRLVRLLGKMDGRKKQHSHSNATKPVGLGHIVMRGSASIWSTWAMQIRAVRAVVARTSGWTAWTAIAAARRVAAAPVVHGHNLNCKMATHSCSKRCRACSNGVGLLMSPPPHW